MKKVAVLLSDGFEEIEALTVVDILRRGGLDCLMVSINNETVIGAHNINVKADKLIDDSIKEFDMVVLPGGMPGSKHLKESNKVIEIIQSMFESGKKVAAICAAPIALGKAGILEGIDVTCYPGNEGELKGANLKTNSVVVCKNVITSRGPATAMQFSYTLLKELGYEEKAKELEKGMLYKN